MTYKLNTGYAQLVIPKSVHQPPFAVRWRNKWWQTPYANRDALWARFEPLDFGYRRLLDYLERTRLCYSNLPMLPPEALEAQGSTLRTIIPGTDTIANVQRKTAPERV